MTSILNCQTNQLFKYVFLFLIVMASFLTCSTNADTALDRQKEALDMIADFADRFCKDIPLVGQGDSRELSGQAKAELSGIVKKLADLGLEGAGKYQQSEYQGLLQRDFIEGLKSSVDCRLKIWNDLKSTLMTESPAVVAPDTDVRKDYTPTEPPPTMIPPQRKYGLDYWSSYSHISGPSFRCSAATLPVEILICRDPSLRQADGIMGAMYQDLRRVLSTSTANQVRSAQRQWIKERDRVCPVSHQDLTSSSRSALAVSCLLGQIQARSNELWVTLSRVTEQ